MSVRSRIALKCRADPHLWIEHVVLGKLGSGKLILLTPDLDLIQDDLSGVNGSDVTSYRSVRDDRSILGVTPDNLYLFEDGALGYNISPDEVNEWIEEAQRMILAVDGEPIAPTPAAGGGGLVAQTDLYSQVRKIFPALSIQHEGRRTDF
jgi:hypothetical protein